METKIFTNAYLQELQSEVRATRKCLEGISEDTFKFKPHETSMEMGYLALLVAEIPLWIAYMIDEGEIDFATFKHPTTQSNEELLRYFDDNVKRAEKSLGNATDTDLEKKFSLKSKGELLYSAPIKADIRTSFSAAGLG